MKCTKRTTKCWIYDRDGILLSYGENECFPPFGECLRVGVVQQKHNYTGQECNSIHAEVRAIHNLPKGSKPYRSVMGGHDFYCDDCEQKLKAVGVEVLEVKE